MRCPFPAAFATVEARLDACAHMVEAQARNARESTGSMKILIFFMGFKSFGFGVQLMFLETWNIVQRSVDWRSESCVEPLTILAVPSAPGSTPPACPS